MTDTPTKSGRSNPFWEFSLKLYSSAAVQKACLDLQDGSGVDVNLLLYMLWHAANQRQMSETDAEAALAAVEPWRVGVVVPLRTARRNLKEPAAAMDQAGAEALRAIVKKAELEAERLQQAALFGLTLPSKPTSGDVRQAATSNVEAYAKVLARPLAAAPVGVMLDALDALVAKT